MRSKLKQSIADHIYVARLLRPRPDNEIPPGNGVCLDGGFIDHNDEFENTSIGFRLEDFPDVHLSLQLRKNREFVYADPDLESRIKSQEQTAREEGLGKWWDSIRMLRRGPRTLLEWQGQEAASWKPARPGFHEASHEFLFWSPGQANDPYHPLIEAQFHTGVKGNKRAAVAPSLSDEEAIALWDKLLGSIRVRPMAAPVAEKVDTMPGTVAQAGQPCPQTGWWECLDAAHYGENVRMQGGAIQYIHEGAAMPQARLLKQNWWQSLIGTGSAFESAFPSQWQLSNRRWRARLSYPDDEAGGL